MAGSPLKNELLFDVQLLILISHWAMVRGDVQKGRTELRRIVPSLGDCCWNIILVAWRGACAKSISTTLAVEPTIEPRPKPFKFRLGNEKWKIPT